MPSPPPHNQKELNKLQATNEERQTLALENIADQLSIISDIVKKFDVKTLQFIEKCDSPSGEADENANDAQSTEFCSSVVRGTIETFSVGNYHYTKLADALAEVMRSNNNINKNIKHMLDRKLQ